MMLSVISMGFYYYILRLFFFTTFTLCSLFFRDIFFYTKKKIVFVCIKVLCLFVMVLHESCLSRTIFTLPNIRNGLLLAIIFNACIKNAIDELSIAYVNKLYIFDVLFVLIDELYDKSNENLAHFGLEETFECYNPKTNNVFI